MKQGGQKGGLEEGLLEGGLLMMVEFIEGGEAGEEGMRL